jgi:hypothetical protein
VPIFILLPQVTIRRRLDVAGVAGSSQERLPGLVVGSWIDGRS